MDWSVPGTPIAIALVRRGDAFLVGARAAHSALPGLAEFPGGKCQPEESFAACAVRECREETGIAIQVQRQRAAITHEYPHGRLHLVFFDCVPVSDQQPTPPFRWVGKSDLAELHFPEANGPIVAALLSEP